MSTIVRIKHSGAWVDASQRKLFLKMREPRRSPAWDDDLDMAQVKHNGVWVPIDIFSIP